MNRQTNRKYGWWIVLACCMAACSKEAPGTAPQPKATSRLMMVHPSPYAPALDIRSVFTDTFLVNKQPVIYPGLLEYAHVPAGNRWMFVQQSGTPISSFGVGLYFKPGASYTYVFQRQLLYEDDLTPPADGYARIRVLNNCSYIRPLDCIIRNGDTLAKAIAYCRLTNFQAVRAGACQLDIQDTDASHAYKTGLQTTLDAGKIYTLMITTVPVADTSRILVGTQLIANN